MTEIMEQTKQLHEGEMYEVVKVGREWKFKTKHGVETFKGKKLAIQFARDWKEAEDVK